MTEPPNPVSLGVTQILHDLSMLQDRQIATQHRAQATLETVAPLAGLLALLDPPEGEAQEPGLRRLAETLAAMAASLSDLVLRMRRLEEDARQTHGMLAAIGAQLTRAREAHAETLAHLHRLDHDLFGAGSDPWPA